jgi:hypothetical protein
MPVKGNILRFPAPFLFPSIVLLVYCRNLGSVFHLPAFCIYTNLTTRCKIEWRYHWAEALVYVWRVSPLFLVHHSAFGVLSISFHPPAFSLLDCSLIFLLCLYLRSSLSVLYIRWQDCKFLHVQVVGKLLSSIPLSRRSDRSGSAS